MPCHVGLSIGLQTVQVEKAIKRVCWEDEAIILHNLIASMAPSHLCYALLVKSKPQIVTAIERRGFDKNMKPENLGPWGHLRVSPASHHLVLVNDPTVLLPCSCPSGFHLAEVIFLFSQAHSSSHALLQKAHVIISASLLWSFLWTL